MTQVDLLITGAHVVLPDGVRQVDIAVTGGIITDIVDAGASVDAREVFDLQQVAVA
jgi:dihydroorotase-like cyclic amidohydrolase